DRGRSRKAQDTDQAGARFQIDPHGLCHDQGIRSHASPAQRTGSPLVPAARHQGRGAPCGESFWHWALGADGGHGHAQPPFRSSRLIGAERQPTSDCRQSLQQSPAEELEQLLAMQMLDGTREAMNQIDGVVTDESTYSASYIAELSYLTDTTIRVSRVIRAPIDKVWAAHRSTELAPQWMLGPDGWVMTVCEIAEHVGDSYCYEWETEEGIDRFGFTGELLASDPPHYEMTTEQLIGVEGPGTTNELTLVPVSHGTLLTVVITYPTAELRDVVIDTGMVAGMENSYSRLESMIVSP